MSAGIGCTDVKTQRRSSLESSKIHGKCLAEPDAGLGAGPVHGMQVLKSFAAKLVRAISWRGAYTLRQTDRRLLTAGRVDDDACPAPEDQVLQAQTRRRVGC